MLLRNVYVWAGHEICRRALGVFHKFLFYFRVVKQLAVCMCIPPNNFWTLELIFMKIGLCIMPPEINLIGVARDKSSASVIPTLSPIYHTIQIIKLLECLNRSLWNWYVCRATWGHRSSVLNEPLSPASNTNTEASEIVEVVTLIFITWVPEPIVMILGMHVMPPEVVSPSFYLLIYVA